MAPLRSRRAPLWLSGTQRAPFPKGDTCVSAGHGLVGRAPSVESGALPAGGAENGAPAVPKGATSEWPQPTIAPLRSRGGGSVERGRQRRERASAERARHAAAALRSLEGLGFVCEGMAAVGSMRVAGKDVFAGSQAILNGPMPPRPGRETAPCPRMGLGRPAGRAARSNVRTDAPVFVVRML